MSLYGIGNDCFSSDKAFSRKLIKAVEVCLVLYCVRDLNALPAICPGSSVGRALIPRKQRAVGLNPTQSRYFFEKGLYELFAFALYIILLMTHADENDNVLRNKRKAK